MKDQEVDEICNALRHELRREMLRRMDQSEGPLSANDLADALELRLSRVSYHLSVLAHSELVAPITGGDLRLDVLDHRPFVVGPKVRESTTIRAMLGLEPPPGAPNEARELVVFGDRVRRLRETKGLSCQRLAEQVDLGVDQLQDIERGLFNPLLKTVVALAGALEVELTEIVADLRP